MGVGLNIPKGTCDGALLLRPENTAEKAYQCKGREVYSISC